MNRSDWKVILYRKNYSPHTCRISKCEAYTEGECRERNISRGSFSHVRIMTMTYFYEVSVSIWKAIKKGNMLCRYSKVKKKTEIIKKK